MTVPLASDNCGRSCGVLRPRPFASNASRHQICTPVYSYLTMTAGSRAGTSFLLDPTEENRIGRGLECAIVLTDPLCSRVHAIVSLDDRRLENSRRRKPQRHVVNDQKIDDASGRRQSDPRSARPSSAFQQIGQPRRRFDRRPASTSRKR